MVPTYKWVTSAKKFVGLREVKGPKTNPIIAGWLKTLKAWYGDDETPWCGTFIGSIMHDLGYQIPKLYMRAKSWADWGSKVPVCYGAIGYMSREGGGHVTIVVGRTKEGHVVGLGGNQGDMVQYSKFPVNRFEGYRFPPGEKIPLVTGLNTLPVLEITGGVSVNEA